MDVQQLSDRRLIAVGLLGIILSGCMTVTSPRYSISVDNAQELKKLEGVKARVVSIKPGVRYNNACRGAGTIQAPDGMSIPQYIEKAFNDELKNAGIYDQAGVALTGTILQMEFSSTSNVTSGWWALGIDLRSSNKKSMQVQNIYNFDSGWDGGQACNMAGQALMPAVQDFIRKTITDPKFQELLKRGG